MSFVPSNQNGIPFSTLAVLTFYSGVIYVPNLDEVHRLARYLEGGLVLTHQLPVVMDKHTSHLAASFPALAPLTLSALEGQPLSVKLAASSRLVEALGPILMVKLPESPHVPPG